jgi:hypothetical protein
MCKNKNFLDPYIVTMHLLQKKVYRGISVVVCTQKTICFLRDHGRNDGMSTSSADNVHGVEDDNSNPYRTMTFPLRFQHLWIELKKIQFGIKM